MKALELRLVRPGPSDRPDIERLFELTIRHTFEVEGAAHDHTADMEFEIALQKELLKRDFDSGGQIEHFIVAKVGAVAIGTAACGPPSELIRSYLDPGENPEVKSVYVLPEFQGQGVGTALWRSIVARLKQQGCRQYCLDSGYTGGQRFWQKHLGPPRVIVRDRYGAGAHHMFWLVSVF